MLQTFEMSCSTPVIFLIFCRPDLTARVFEAIRQAQPPELIVIADGPRNEQEADLCKQARAITENIDWNCNVMRNYANVNLGCRDRISSGLTWAFKQVEEAIILEDDCLPDPSFFEYCDVLLEQYRSDKRVMVVSGNNFQNGQRRTSYSYYFSKYNHCWGWATWRRAWEYWGFSPKKWLEFRDAGLLASVCGTTEEFYYWTNIFNTLFLENKPDTWDYVWTFACWAQSGLTVLPSINLVTNIGFDPRATHTSRISPYANLPVGNIGEIIHPPFVLQHQKADQYTFETVFKVKKSRGASVLASKIRKRLSTFKGEKVNGYKSFN